jgi:hypothetical protein
MQGKKNAPCIIFIDEIDAVGRHRGAGLGGGHDEREQTLNQLLVEMDGFESSEGVIIIAATNRPDVLDPAMLRPGRFDRHVVVPRPDLRGREAILNVHTRRVVLAPGVDLSVIARGTPGFSGADLENLVNEAALVAARRDAESVTLDDFEMAKDRVLLGAERRTLVMSEKERRVSAYHEAGHALVALLEESCDPVHKVTIIPRGMALGVTMTLPTEDRHTMTRAELLGRLLHAMGGRAAEEVVFDHLSTGASDDLQKATELARQMVCRFGMSDKLGRTGLRAAPGVQRGNRPRDRRGGLGPAPELLRAREEDPGREASGPGPDRGGAARARDARRSRAPASAGRTRAAADPHACSSRGGGGATDAPPAGARRQGSVRRQAHPRSRADAGVGAVRHPCRCSVQRPGCAGEPLSRAPRSRGAVRERRDAR